VNSSLIELRLILKNQRYYWLTVLPIAVFCSLFLLAALDSFVLVSKVNFLSNSALQALQTDLILQSSKTAKTSGISPRKLIIPPSLAAFSKKRVIREVRKMPQVTEFSTALTLWQMSPKGTTTFVALDPSEAAIGANKVKSLIYQGRFLSSAKANEIVLERHFAKLFNYRLKQKYQLGGRELEIVGIVDFKNSSNLNNAAAFIPYYTAKEITGLSQEVVNQAFIHLHQATDVPKIKPLLARQLPYLKVITQDSLLKNLSGLNAMIFKFGKYFLTAIVIITIAAVAMGLRFYLLDFTNQHQILRMIGWNKVSLRRWQAIELTTILVLSTCLAIGGYLSTAPLISQQIKLQVSVVSKLKP
jgi:hypothetical protein